ncbi:MAG: SusC/RagA family TonB-linked outer membrane protein [Bacteroidota bacterium]
MKLTTILLLIATLQIFAKGVYSQYTELTLNMGETNVGQVLAEIENQSEFYFLFNQKLVDTDREVNIQLSHKKIGEILDLVFAETNTDYVVMDRQIVLSPKEYLTEVKAALQPGPQPATISGMVSDQNGEPLPGVSISVKGSVRGTITDAEGKYRIEVEDPQSAVLIFSFIGYLFQEISTAGKSIIDVSMEVDAIGIDEVVVTALGIEKDKKQITYSAQNVEADMLTQARELNVANSLAGKVAGMDVISSGSGVGGATRVVLRGNRSLTGNNQPLYIVDGVPISSNPMGWSPDSEGGGIQSGDGVSNINPDDIESITVLKGPSAVALYGSRASNGAIVIATRKGAVGQGIGVEFNSNSSMEQAMLLYKYQHLYGQGYEGVYVRDAEEAWGPRMDGQMVGHWSNDPEFAGAQYAFSPHPDNLKDFYQTGYTTANTLSVTGGTAKMRSRFSYTNTLSQGIVENNKLKRHNVNLRIDGNLTDRLSIDAKLTYFNQSLANRLGAGGWYTNPTKHIMRMPSNISVEEAKHYDYYDLDGNLRQNYWHPTAINKYNPYWATNRILSNETRNRILGMGVVRYRFTDNLSLMVRTAIDQISDISQQNVYTETWGWADYGDVFINTSSVMELNNDFLLNYNSIVGDNLLSLDLSFGGNMLHQKSWGLGAETNDLYKPNLFDIENTSLISAGQWLSERKLNSLYAFATIGLKNFLFLDITARNDWSSTLPPENWSYFYPSAGLTWVLTDMLETSPSFLTFAKLRASYAEVGNDTDPYVINPTYYFFGGGLNGYVAHGNSLPALDLKPEQTKSTELGFDVRFFQNRLGVDFTWYKSNTFNQLLNIPLPQASGYRSKFINAGNVQNQGVEITLNATPVRTADFSWDLSFNYARNENMVIELTDELEEYIIRGRVYMSTVKVVEGEEYGQIYTRGFVRNDAGRVLVNDLGLPVTTAGNELPMGNYNPDWMGGVTSAINYKGINLTAVIDARMGGTLISSTQAWLTYEGKAEATLEGRDGMVVDGVMESDGSENTIVVSGQEYWHALGGEITPVGEPYVYDASFIRLREIMLGYTWNLKSSVVQSIGLSLYGKNLGYLYNPSEILDPAVSVGVGNVQGIEAFGTPTSRTFGFNARFKF